MILKAIFIFHFALIAECVTNSYYREKIKDALRKDYLFDPIMIDLDEYTDIINKNQALAKIFYYEQNHPSNLQKITKFDDGEVTYWCGPGNSSRDGGLGRASKTDACCREHDKCPISVGAKKEIQTDTKVFDIFKGKTCFRTLSDTYSYTV